MAEAAAARTAIAELFESRKEVVVERGIIMPSTDITMPVFIGVSLRGIEPEEDVDGALSLLAAGLSVLLQVSVNDYGEEVLYSDYFLPAIRRLEEADWVFDGSNLEVGKEGTKLLLSLRAELRKTPG